MAQIKVRLKNGKLYNVKDAAFVEICNDVGALACLVYMQNSGVVKVCYPNDEEYARYLTFYKGKRLPFYKINPEDKTLD